MKLAGKVALITGGTGGLGLAIAEAFLKEGASIIACARTIYKMDADIVRLQDYIQFYACDVTSLVHVFNMIESVRNTFGTIDILVNCAGVLGQIAPLDQANYNEWKKAVEVNLYGPMLTMATVLPQMQSRGSGKIINISGGGATKPMPGLSAYAASKAALVRLTETVALEVKEHGIDVNAVAPGVLPTQMLDEQIAAGPDKIGQEYYDELIEQKERGLSFDRATELCTWLASSKSDGVTGRLLSAQWDFWQDGQLKRQTDDDADLYTLRRNVK